MGKIETEGLAAQLAALLHDQYYSLASREAYEAALDTHSGEPRTVKATPIQATRVYRWKDDILLWKADISDPLPESDYLISPMQCRVVTSADSRPSVSITGLPVDLEGVRRAILEPLILDRERADKYLEYYGLHRRQIGDSAVMVRNLIETGRPI